MEIKITATPKEMAALVVALQERPDEIEVVYKDISGAAISSIITGIPHQAHKDTEEKDPQPPQTPQSIIR